MTEEQARAEAFGDITQVQGGYDQRFEPVTGRQFVTFSGVAQKPEGDGIAAGGIQPTAAEAMRVHIEALKPWLAELMSHFTSPVVCVRQFPKLERTDGGWVAYTRLLVTSGRRDVEAISTAPPGIVIERPLSSLPYSEQGVTWDFARTGAPEYCWKRKKIKPEATIRGVVIADQPVVGVAQ